MSYPVSNLINRTRSKVDQVVNAKDIIPQDGTQYTVVLTNNPIVSGSDLLPGNGFYLVHSTFTTGRNQFIPQNNFQSNSYASGNNIVYTINYDRGEVNFYQGSGTLITSTGLSPFAPWNTANAVFYYKTSKYSDRVIADHISYAVADVESALQLGLMVSGTVVAPTIRDQSDFITNQVGTPYTIGETYIIGEPIEIVQNLISLKAAINIIQAERRVGVGNAIKLRDGDTEIDSSVNQKYYDNLYKDMKMDYENKLKFIMMNMLDGMSLRQIDERAGQFMYSNFYANGGLAVPTDW